MDRSSSDNFYDFAVVGYGPVGAVIASLLARKGHRVVVIETRAEIFPHPRAIAFDSDAMRIFQSIGLADRLVDYLSLYLPTEYRGVDGQPIAHFISRPKTELECWDSNYVFNSTQMELELRQTIDELGEARPDILLSHRLVDFREEADHCALDIEAADGTKKTVFASYLLGSDGANSLVRRLLGIELESYDFDRPFIVIDAEVSLDVAAQLPQINIQYCDPTRPTTYIVGPKLMRRWEIMLLPDEDPVAESSPEGLKRHLDRWLPESGYKVLRAAAYVFHGLIAREWRKGRILMLGDAVHQTPPFMGQGLCQGIRDASNLAWKLDFVHRGKAHESLLDSYQQERGPHVEATTRQAIRLGSVICETDAERAAARDQRMREENGVPPKTIIRQSMIPPLENGVLSAKGGALRGTIVPQPSIMSDGKRSTLLDDVAGSIRLIEIAADHEHLDADARMVFHSLGGTIILLSEHWKVAVEDDRNIIVLPSLALRTYLEDNGARGILVRPDNYIFGSYSSCAEMRTLLDEYLQMISAPSPAKQARTLR